MKAYIDRIEDGKIAVVVVEKIGQLLVPAKNFPYKIHDGMHLTIELKPDPRSESDTLAAVKKLQEKLLKRSQKNHPSD